MLAGIIPLLAAGCLTLGLFPSLVASGLGRAVRRGGEPGRPAGRGRDASRPHRGARRHFSCVHRGRNAHGRSGCGRRPAGLGVARAASSAAENWGWGARVAVGSNGVHGDVVCRAAARTRLRRRAPPRSRHRRVACGQHPLVCQHGAVPLGGRRRCRPSCVSPRLSMWRCAGGNSRVFFRTAACTAISPTRSSACSSCWSSPPDQRAWCRRRRRAGRGLPSDPRRCSSDSFGFVRPRLGGKGRTADRAAVAGPSQVVVEGADRTRAFQLGLRHSAAGAGGRATLVIAAIVPLVSTASPFGRTGDLCTVVSLFLLGTVGAALAGLEPGDRVRWDGREP